MEWLTAVTEGVDAATVSQQMITSLTNELDQVNGQLQVLRDAGGIGSFDVVEQHLDNVVAEANRWPFARGIPPDEVREAASRFRRSAGQQLAGLDQSIQESEGRLQELQAAIQALEQNRTATDAETQQRLEELTTQIQRERSRLDESLQQHQQQFSEAQERRVEQFGNQATELENRVSAVEAASKEELRSTSEETEKKSQELIAALQQQLAEAQRIVGAIATTGLVGGFQQEAKSQRSTADYLRVGALITAAIAAGIAVWGIVHAQNHSPSVTQTITRVVGSLVFAGIAGYLATQSNRHREREELAKRRELGMSVLAPLLEGMESERANQINETVVTALFSGGTTVGGSRSNPLTSDDLSALSLFGQFVDIVRKAPSS